MKSFQMTSLAQEKISHDVMNRLSSKSSGKVVKMFNINDHTSFWLVTSSNVRGFVLAFESRL